MQSFNSPLPTSLEEECQKCAKIIDSFAKPEDQQIRQVIKTLPANIIKEAKGIAIMSVVKAGLIWSGRGGSGLIISRLDNGEWSAPSAIMTMGTGIGWQIGAEITDYVIILNTKEAVEGFYSSNFTLGGNMSVAAGPYGRSAEVAGEVKTKMAPIYSYSNSKGLFAGVSLEGSVIMERKDANEKFYKAKVSAKDILSGFVQRPDSAKVLYDALNKHQ